MGNDTSKAFAETRERRSQGCGTRCASSVAPTDHGADSCPSSPRSPAWLLNHEASHAGRHFMRAGMLAPERARECVLGAHDWHRYPKITRRALIRTTPIVACCSSASDFHGVAKSCRIPQRALALGRPLPPLRCAIRRERHHRWSPGTEAAQTGRSCGPQRAPTNLICKLPRRSALQKS